MLLCCSSIATAASAADQARTLSLSGGGPTVTDLMWAVCDADTVIAYDRGATSGTNAGRKLVYSSGWTVSTFSGPAPTTYGNARGLGCVSNTIILSGGDIATNGSEWLYTAATSAPGTWTSRVNQTNTNFDRWHHGQIVATLGNKTYTSGFMLEWTDDHDYTEVANFDAVSYSLGTTAAYDTGSNTFGKECSGAKGASNHYGAGCWASAGLYVAGSSGSALTYSNGLGPINCGGLSGGTLVARQSFGAVGMSNNPVFHLAYQGTNSQVCGVSWSGAAAGRIADQGFSSLSMVGGAYFGGEPLIWSSGGTAYNNTGGSVATYFANKSGTSLDFACASGVLTGVTSGVDVDHDGDATDNLLGFCSDGNLVYYGEAQPSSGAGSRPKGSRPFDTFPFTRPGEQ